MTVTVTVLLVFLALPVLGEDPLVSARRAQRDGDPAAEHAACSAVLEGDASPASTRACTERMAWLAARRDADGTWRGLRLLERARRGDPVRPQLERLVNDTRLALPVVMETQLWLARADLNNGALDAALDRTTALWTQVEAQPETPTARQVAALHAQVLARSGRLGEAESTEAHLADRRSSNPREGVAQERRIQRRARLTTVSWGIWVGGLAGALPAAWRARTERGRFEGLLALWVVGLGMGGLAWLRDPSTAAATASLLGMLSVQAVLSAHALRGARPGLPRLALRLLLGAAAAASSVLVLDHHGFLVPLLG